MIRPGDLETVANLLCHLRSGRSRQCQHPPNLEIPGQLRQFQIVGAEVMSPLGHTVRLIHCHHADRQAFQPCQKTLVGEALRRHIEQLDGAIVEPLIDRLQLTGIHTGIQSCCRDIQPIKLVYLILHQRNQRRHNQRQSIQHQCRQLITQALATASGKHGQRRTPGQ